GGADGFARGEPAESIAARTACGRAQRGEIALRFAGESLTVARGGKKCERFQSGCAGADGVPDRADATTGRGDDAETRDDWGTVGHYETRLAWIKPASTR